MADTEAPNPVALADKLRDALGKIGKGRTGREPSPLREHVALVFPEMNARRQAGATWDALAQPFRELGVLTAQGKPPTGVDVRNAFHAERYKTDGKPKRRKAKPKGPRPGPLPPSPAPPPPPPAAAPLDAGSRPFSTGDVEIDRKFAGIRTLKPLPPMGNMDTHARRAPKPTTESSDDDNQTG